MTIYRIIQEQLNNVLKYADGSKLSIRLLREADQVSIIVKDNGKGFDQKVTSTGVGITNIISRIELYNGHVEIDTAPGKGCTMKVTMEVI